LLRPSSETWELVERWLPTAAQKGFRFGLADWLITALANEIDSLIWSRDEDFTQLEQLKMAQLYLPSESAS
jgi:predicted nucleic acid-binding protein